MPSVRGMSTFRHSRIMTVYCAARPANANNRPISGIMPRTVDSGPIPGSPVLAHPCIRN